MTPPLHIVLLAGVVLFFIFAAVFPLTPLVLTILCSRLIYLGAGLYAVPPLWAHTYGCEVPLLDVVLSGTLIVCALVLATWELQLAAALERTKSPEVRP
ncbi:hypothetical protein NVS55_40090 (plasmid) [Myxococcus stipitatus]|uniref:hypothetical protein n=1 Tax=Myxococcus stipitatus TaxID=83455 RepID=UPI0031456FD7